VISSLSSHQALELTASFAFTAERMRADSESQARANLYERASRIAFLRAHRIAQDEEARPAFGQMFRRAVFALA
jgi:hypothetical protein